MTILMLMWLREVQPQSGPNGGILSVLGAALSGTAIGAIINGFFNKRRLTAETVEIIGRAASGVIQNVQEDVRRARERADKLETELDEQRVTIEKMERDIRAERRRWNLLIDAHMRWDKAVIDQIREAAPQLVLPEPPSLYLEN